MDIDTIKYFSTLGVGGVIAGFMFIFYRRDVKELIAQWRGQSEMLMQVVIANTAAITANTKTIEALHQRDDEIQAVLKRLGYPFQRPAREEK